MPIVRTSSTREPCGRAGPRPTDRWLIGTVATAALLVAGQQTTAADKENKLPPKEEVTLVTKDDVVLRATYWPGTRDKESVPVILLHGYGGSRQDFHGLAELLQQKGFAPIALDLRGHGDSTQIKEVRKPLQASTMPSAHFPAMIEDVEAVKQFILAKNNAGQLNIDKLCIVGTEMGALVGANWAITDWDWPELAVGKQGQDVKAMVLISPPEKFKGLRMAEPLGDRAVRSQLSYYIAVGKEDPAAVRDATKIYTSLARYHPQPSKIENKDLFFDATMPTKLQGTKLLDNEFKLPDRIVEFLEARGANQPYPWKDRAFLNTR
ncbi:MAG: alpha/beta fold hydrolase [Planctomycetia bacterium]|nr:alpha/beta fold hydrolase [Planctomycetia bacterium]